MYNWIYFRVTDKTLKWRFELTFSYLTVKKIQAKTAICNNK